MCGFSNHLSAENKGVIISWSFKDTVAIVFMKFLCFYCLSHAPELIEEKDECCPKYSQ